MASDNPYCRPRLMSRRSAFYSGQAPRPESLYDRGNLGPPIYGEYRDRWTGTEWLRPNGSSAPLAGLGLEYNVRDRSAPFVAAGSEAQSRATVLEFTRPTPTPWAPSADPRGGAATTLWAPQVMTPPAPRLVDVLKRNALPIVGGLALLTVGYFVFRGK